MVKKKKIQYSADYDAHYDELSGEWVEGICTDPDCEFCRNRPPRPKVQEPGDPQDMNWDLWKPIKDIV
jgi:hypothetical protein